MKKLCLSILTCFVFALSAFGLIGCDKGEKGNTITNQVPVYQGMSIAKNNRASITSATLANGNSDISLCAMDDDDFEYEDDDDLDEDIEDIVQIEVKGDETTKYYVQPKEVFIVQVHIDNPSSYEIQSFTLNGSKYANYMFKDGSTMELLLLEVTAPSTAGYLELTIDAIKYIDGTEIKDVRLDGEKTIKAGVAFTQPPTESLSNVVVSTTSVSFGAQITDTQNVIGNNEIKAYLSNGAEIVAEKEIEVGVNNVTFDNLLMGTTYEIGIATSYDYIDGYGIKVHWLLTQTIATQKAFMITDVTIGQETINFVVEKLGYVGELTKIELIDGVTNTTVQTLTDTTLRSFDSLLSNHPYKIALHFSYENNGAQVNDTSVISFTTRGKTVPTIAVTNDNVTDTTVKGTLSVTDIDDICAINSVKIYKGETTVATNEQKKVDFSGLEYYTDYKVVVNYSYDLNDGFGVQTKEFIKEYKTSPHLVFNNCNIINTSAVSEGDTIYMQVSLDNPSGALPQSVIVNGQSYNCTGSTTATKIYVEIVNEGQFAGGDTTLTIEQVNMALDGKTYSVLAEENNYDNVFINGKLEIKSIDVVVKEGDEYVKKDYVFPSETTYLMVTLSNKTGYAIDNIKINSTGYSDFIKVSNDIWIKEVSLYNKRNTFAINELLYSNSYISKTITYSSSSVQCLCYKLISDETKYVSTSNDLLNMNEGYYYELKNDIDLSGIEWNCGNFNGVFNGNNFAIKNMSYVGTISTSERYIYLGLFGLGEGAIENLKIKNATYMVEIVSDYYGTQVYYGGLVANADGGIIINNCSIDSDSFVKITSDSAFCYTGGLLGTCENSKITNSYNAGVVSGTYMVGGLFCICGDSIIMNCYNTGVVSGIISEKYPNSNMIGGLISHSGGNIIVNCYNIPSTISDDCNSSFRYSSNDIIMNCYSCQKIINQGDSGTILPTNCYVLGENCTLEDLDSKAFYTEKLGWSEEIWDFSNLDIKNGKCPTLK